MRIAGSGIASGVAMTLGPRLVPAAHEALGPPEFPPSSQGLVSQLGVRRETGIGAASTGVGLTPMFQPVVLLPDEQVVGYEALARWPMYATVTPHNVFSFARASNRTDVLDRQCIDAAVRAALDAELAPGSLLLINTEPAVPHVPRANSPLADACERFQVVFEITERDLLAHPCALLKKAEAIRADGIAIAIDDVGAHPDSLATLDVLAPDIVKLDMEMIQNSPERDRANTLTGVLAYHERSGALIVAEGVETEQHLDQAVAVGATLAQGYKFGQAAPLNRHHCVANAAPRIHDSVGTGGVIEGAAEDDRQALRIARRDVVAGFARHIEEQARHAIDRPVVLVALHDAQDFNPGWRHLYEDLASTSPLVVVFGRDVPTDVGGGFRGVELPPGDPLCDEWVVVTLGPDTCRALVARELAGAPARNGDRRFEFLITADRGLVTRAARSLLARIP